MESELSEMLTLPVKVADHYKFSVIFFTLGFFLTCWFFLYIVNFFIMYYNMFGRNVW